jgi:uncharacterized protein YyaL (SSP411 family)
MLYDQALLIMVYSEAYQATKKLVFKKTAREIIEYVIRDMTSEEGGFYSAEDADSEGKEGRFYTWAYDELEKILTLEELDLVARFYNARKEGNFTSESGEKGVENIFYQSNSTEDYAKLSHINQEKLKDDLERIRKKLFQRRKKRVHPEKDDKILTDWNGLMIAALAKAAQVFDDKTYVEKAEEAVKFISKNLMLENNKLLHSYRKGKAEIDGYADDYAFFILGLIELYQVTFNSRYLKMSLDLNKYLIDHFWDKADGGLYFTSDIGEKSLVRTKEAFDGAIPSANSVTMYNFVRLARITGDAGLEEKARQIGSAFSDEIMKTPGGYSQLMSSLDFAIGPSFEIVVVGKKDEEDTQNMIRYINSIYLPNKVVILKDLVVKGLLIAELAPFVKDYTQIKNQATVYVCRNHQCQSPVTDIEKLRQLLT